MRPLNACGSNITKIDFITDEEKGIRELEEALKNDIKAVILTHSSNVTGDILPIEK